VVGARAAVVIAGLVAIVYTSRTSAPKTGSAKETAASVVGGWARPWNRRRASHRGTSMAGWPQQIAAAVAAAAAVVAAVVAAAWGPDRIGWRPRSEPAR
jgi:hypothetical protein